MGSCANSEGTSGDDYGIFGRADSGDNTFPSPCVRTRTVVLCQWLSTKAEGTYLFLAASEAYCRSRPKPEIVSHEVSIEKATRLPRRNTTLSILLPEFILFY